MKTTSAQLKIELNIICPHCWHCIDLVDSPLNEEGGIIRAAVGDGNWGDAHRDFEEEVECPECSKEFKVEGIEW